MDRTIRGYRFDDEHPIAVGVSSVTYRAVREGAADVIIPVTIKVIDLRAALEDTGQRQNVDLLDSPPLQHGCIVDVRDVIRMGEGRVGIVREYVDGQSVVELLERLGETPLDAPAALFIAKQCASALAHAHSRNLVHGDFCHRHVLLSVDGQVKVSDFQLSSLLARAARSETRLRAGKRFFFAPELWVRPTPPPTAESDVFALGVLLYRMVRGHFPWADADALLERLEPDFALGDEDWSGPVSKLLGECLAFEPELRPPAGEVERRLRRILGTNWAGYGASELGELLDRPARSPVPPPAVIDSGPPPAALRAGMARVPAPADRRAARAYPSGDERAGTDPLELLEPRPASPAPAPVAAPRAPAADGFVPQPTRVGQRPTPVPASRPATPAADLLLEGAVEEGRQRGLIPVRELSERVPALEQRLVRLESTLYELAQRQASGEEAGAAQAELLERLANLEETNSYLARELEALRDRYDRMVAGMAALIQVDLQG